MLVKDLLDKYERIDTNYFILDSHQDNMGDLIHSDNDFVTYHYNVRRYNKLTPGAIFLYRRPKKSSKKRKFYIYGGGMIESISTPDQDGYVYATIINGFKLLEPIYEDDQQLQNLEFEFKKRPKKPSWEHFWNQYGMNKITKNDFWAVVNGIECSPAEQIADQEITVKELMEEDAEVEDIDVSKFIVSFNDRGKTSIAYKVTGSKTSIGRHVDFDSLNRKKKQLGTAGELLVLNSEIEYLKSIGKDYPIEYVADTQGDGLGFDIKSFTADGKEVHIEVKTTRASTIDGFYLSPKELEESKNPNYIYKIYRVYNFDEKNKTADIKVYEGAVSETQFKLVPVSYKVTLK